MRVKRPRKRLKLLNDAEGRRYPLKFLLEDLILRRAAADPILPDGTQDLCNLSYLVGISEPFEASGK